MSNYMGRAKKEYAEVDIMRVEAEYNEGGIFGTRDDRAESVIRAMHQTLTRDERRVLILYSENGCNMVRTARQIGVSTPTLRAFIAKLRQRILNELDSIQL